MIILVQCLSADGQFSIPGTRQTVDGALVRRAVGRLPMRERGEVFDCFASGMAPSDEVAEALRRKIIELAEERRDRKTP